MSSKGRGEDLGGDKSDYPTPAWCVHRLLEAWQPYPGVLVEPCAGAGNIVQTINDWFEPGMFRWMVAELCEDRFAELQTKLTDRDESYCGDFLSKEANVIPHDFDVRRRPPDLHRRIPVSAVVTNPPYPPAARFVETCRVLYPEAEIVMLLRMGFLESEERVDWFLRNGVPDAYVLPNRPQFRRAQGKKGSDSATYAWFLWPPGPPRAEGKVTLLNPTPLDVRRKYEDEETPQ